jgi:dolichol-phosphate mannosyltransferase
MTQTKPLLSVVSPVFEEEAALPAFHRALCEVLDWIAGEYDAEVVYVDDGSGDGTLPLLRRLAAADGRVRYLSFSRNFGHQAALTAGLEGARGDVVVTLDSDLQHPPALIPTLLAQWRAGHDVVVTIREEDPALGRFKRLSSRWYYALLSRFSEAPIRPAAADFRLTSRRALDALLRLRETHRFLRGMVEWLGFPAAEVRFTPAPRAAGASKFTLRRLLAFGFDGLLSFSRAPLRAPLYLGLALALAGLAYGAGGLAGRLAGLAAQGPSATLAALLVVGGAVLWSLGVLGEYVGRIYEQVKGRPLYVVKESSPERAPAGREAGGSPLRAGPPLTPSPLPGGERGRGEGAEAA